MLRRRIPFNGVSAAVHSCSSSAGCPTSSSPSLYGDIPPASFPSHRRRHHHDCCAAPSSSASPSSYCTTVHSCVVHYSSITYAHPSVQQQQRRYFSHATSAPFWFCSTCLSRNGGELTHCENCGSASNAYVPPPPSPPTRMTAATGSGINTVKPSSSSSPSTQTPSSSHHQQQQYQSVVESSSNNQHHHQRQGRHTSHHYDDQQHRHTSSHRQQSSLYGSVRHGSAGGGDSRSRDRGDGGPHHHHHHHYDRRRRDGQSSSSNNHRSRRHGDGGHHHQQQQQQQQQQVQRNENHRDSGEYLAQLSRAAAEAVDGCSSAPPQRSVLESLLAEEEEYSDTADAAATTSAPSSSPIASSDHRGGGGNNNTNGSINSATLLLSELDAAPLYNYNAPTPRGGRDGRSPAHHHAGRHDQGWGGGSSNSNVREGDWACAVCSYSNFAGRSDCRRCKAVRAHSAVAAAEVGRGLGGDGSGADGGEEHRHSIAATSHAEGRDMPGARGNTVNAERHSSSNVREGDWACAVCSYSNFAGRSDCRRCKAAKPIPGSLASVAAPSAAAVAVEADASYDREEEGCEGGAESAGPPSTAEAPRGRSQHSSPPSQPEVRRLTTPSPLTMRRAVRAASHMGWLVGYHDGGAFGHSTRRQGGGGGAGGDADSAKAPLLASLPPMPMLPSFCKILPYVKGPLVGREAKTHSVLASLRERKARAKAMGDGEEDEAPIAPSAASASSSGSPAPPQKEQWGTLQLGDWGCGYCGAHNKSRWALCCRCGANKFSTVMNRGPSEAASSQQQQQQQKGDGLSSSSSHPPPPPPPRLNQSPPHQQQQGDECTATAAPQRKQLYAVPAVSYVSLVGMRDQTRLQQSQELYFAAYYALCKPLLVEAARRAYGNNKSKSSTSGSGGTSGGRGDGSMIAPEEEGEGGSTTSSSSSGAPQQSQQRPFGHSAFGDLLPIGIGDGGAAEPQLLKDLTFEERALLLCTEPAWLCRYCGLTSLPSDRLSHKLMDHVRKGNLSVYDAYIVKRVLQYRPTCDHCMTQRPSEHTPYMHPGYTAAIAAERGLVVGGDDLSSSSSPSSSSSTSQVATAGAARAPQDAKTGKFIIKNKQLSNLAGDWSCRCGTTNYRLRRVCSGCGMGRLKGMLPLVVEHSGSASYGDWMCSCCLLWNFRQNPNCFNCCWEKGSGVDMMSTGRSAVPADGGKGQQQQQQQGSNLGGPRGKYKWSGTDAVLMGIRFDVPLPAAEAEAQNSKILGMLRAGGGEGDEGGGGGGITPEVPTTIAARIGARAKRSDGSVVDDASSPSVVANRALLAVPRARKYTTGHISNAIYIVGEDIVPYALEAVIRRAALNSVGRGYDADAAAAEGGGEGGADGGWSRADAPPSPSTAATPSRASVVLASGRAARHPSMANYARPAAIDEADGGGIPTDVPTHKIASIIKRTAPTGTLVLGKCPSCGYHHRLDAVGPGSTCIVCATVLYPMIFPKWERVTRAEERMVFPSAHDALGDGANGDAQHGDGDGSALVGTSTAGDAGDGNSDGKGKRKGKKGAAAAAAAAKKAKGKKASAPPLPLLSPLPSTFIGVPRLSPTATRMGATPGFLLASLPCSRCGVYNSEVRERCRRCGHTESWVCAADVEVDDDDDVEGGGGGGDAAALSEPSPIRLRTCGTINSDERGYCRECGTARPADVATPVRAERTETSRIRIFNR